MPFLDSMVTIVRQRCPHCRRGKVFAGSVKMNESCPVCHLRFEREPGYFLGAMYFSYGMMSAIMLAFMYGFYLLWPSIDLGWTAFFAIVASSPLTPLVFRVSRVMWIAYERWAWPDEHSL